MHFKIMAAEKDLQLGRRERQIMDVIYRLGKASVTDVRSELSDPPSYSAVRAMLGFLEDKGYLRHEPQGLKYVYMPMQDTMQVRASALKHVVKTFFGGSPERAVEALLEMSDARLTPRDKQYLSQLIKKAQQEGR
ncbi:MAG TPA: BlaI/MecI/CopY family transcriptional regulator [Candidatus Angelobacter sp.]|jgi:BlaI family transcriptional regulator, penicillinase repressor|nr:BlaI/MecI/CopY family transcriptional regulator [Candidatus Angelobacter sp.]